LRFPAKLNASTLSTVAWRRVLLPAKCFTRTINLGSHHLASVSRDDSVPILDNGFTINDG
jgi:hypothetical protein